MISCIILAESPPSQFSYNLLENAFLERELKERLYIPTVECSKDLHNAFNVSRIRTCLKSAETSYWAMLNTTQLTAEMYSANALTVRKLVKRCQCRAETELQKQMKVDLWSLETCIMQATKRRPNIPKMNFCVSSTKCRFANVSAEDDEGEIIVDDGNVTTTKAPLTVDDRFGVNSTVAPPVTIPSVATPATPPVTIPSVATPATPATKPPTPKPWDEKVCTAFNDTYGEFGCGEEVKYPRDIITPAQFWSTGISWEL